MMNSQNNISSFSGGIKFCVVAFFAAISILGCVKGDIPELNISTNSDSYFGKTEARLSVAQPTSSTRTEIDPDDMSTVRWSIGDEAAVWATDEATSEEILTGEKFTLRYFGTTYSTAEFSAIIDPLDEEKQYTYAAFYPYPKQINSDGTIIYNIPAVQSGEYDGVADIRVADAVSGGAITGSTLGGATLSFRSLAHAFRISVPEGYNNLGGEIKELVVEMPTEIVGDFSFDMNDTQSAPIAVAGSQSRGAIVNMENKSEAWLFFNPAANVTGDIKIYGVNSDNEYSMSYDIALSNHTFAAGRITPVYTMVMEEMPLSTLKIKIGENNLGEDVEKVRVTAPNGVVFKESSSNTMEFDAAQVADGEYELSYYAYFYGDMLRSGDLQIEFESESAIISAEDISMANIIDDTVNDISVDVPYPIFMDFSTLTEDFSIHDNIATSMSGIDASYDEWTDLSEYGLPEGWTAGRVGGSASAGSLRICGREEAGSKYPGRLDSPQFAWLKPGKSVKVRVSYNYSGNQAEYKGWGGKNGDACYKFGYDTRSGGFNGNEPINGAVIMDWYEHGTSGSYTSITQSASHEIEEATNETRATWRASCNKDSALIQNGNYWLYIDNITVQIVK
ncbi:MAG: fimbrillin family protein [Rikenellaceae bacterium]